MIKLNFEILRQLLLEGRSIEFKYANRYYFLGAVQTRKLFRKYAREYVFYELYPVDEGETYFFQKVENLLNFKIDGKTITDIFATEVQEYDVS